MPRSVVHSGTSADAFGSQKDRNSAPVVATRGWTMSRDNLPVRRMTVEQQIEHRRRCLVLVDQALTALREADELFRVATGNAHGFLLLCSSEHRRLSFPERHSSFLEAVTKRFDRDAWLYLMEATGLRALMDHEAVESFRKALETDPPALDGDAVGATFKQFYEDREKTFRRGIVNVFKGLVRPKYRSHDSFKIGRRVILTGALSEVSRYVKRRSELADIERIFYVVDHQPLPDPQYDAAARIHMAQSKHETRCQTDYFELRWFDNGNVHVWFTRPDLVDRVNTLIADHYGESLPGQR